MDLLQRIKNIAIKLGNFPVEVYHAFIAPFRVYRFLKSMLREGFYEISTDFEYEGKPYQFRTLIQPDADIINYIPDITQSTKKTWLETFKKQYDNHLQNIDFFMQRATESHLALSRIIDSGIIALNVYPIWRFVENFNLETIGLSGILVAISAAFRKYLKPYIVRLSLRGIFRIARIYFRKRIK